MLEIDNTALLLVDVQGSLAAAMHDQAVLIRNLARLVRIVQILEMPIVWVEQTPEKLGRTVQELRRFMGRLEPMSKACFSCGDSPEVMSRLQELGRQQVLLAGIETHVCIYQTAVALIDAGYHVEVVADAVSSRAETNVRTGLRKIRDHGGILTSVETAVFELLRTSKHPSFRSVLDIVK